jgi:hydroxymethylglutaryl-CoA lyase
MNFKGQARIFEVGPRDGLQAEDRIISVGQRVELIHRLISSGLSDIEVGSFVREDRIPQLAGTADVIKKLRTLYADQLKKVSLWAFIPNEFGLDRAIEAGVQGASFFVAVSDTFSQKNVNKTRKEILASLPSLIKKAKSHKIKTRVYLSTLVYCPYEGPVSASEVVGVAKILKKMGVQELVLSDTTGDANPKSLDRVLEALVKKSKIFKGQNLALHLHDTRGLALANILLGLEYGIRVFDSSIGGLGGCPYAPGASGNLSTEDLANMLLGMGLIRGIDLGTLGQAGAFAESCFERRLPSRVLRALQGK